jgi:monoamine oxidase
MLGQLELLRGVKIPEPLTTVFIDWSREPYGGAWHMWRPGAKSWELIPQIRHPLPELSIFVTSDAYSSDQGWAEGAVNVAEKVMQVNFGLKAPHWIEDPSYDFGP